MNRVLTPEKELRYAVKTKNNARILELIERGVDIDVQNKYDRTPLFMAVCWKHVETAQLLLKQKANPNCRDLHHWSALHVACENGPKSMVSLLLEYKADANGMDPQKLAPIHCAAANPSLEILAILIPHVSKLDLPNYLNERALDYATEHYRSGNIDLLLEAGAKVHKSSYEITAIKSRRRRLKAKVVIFVGILRKRFGLYRDLCDLLGRAVWATRHDHLFN